MKTVNLILSISILFCGCKEEDVRIFPTKDFLIGKWIEKDKTTYATEIEFTQNDRAFLRPMGSPKVDTLKFSLDTSTQKICFTPITGTYPDSCRPIFYHAKLNVLCIDLYITVGLYGGQSFVKE